MTYSSHFPSPASSSAPCAPTNGSHQHIHISTTQIREEHNPLFCCIAVQCSMDIGVPTNVKHVAHVTFDCFDGFIGLPDEFEPEVPEKAPSASANVFGVSTESMQLSFDSRGNSVPTILLLIQSRLYEQGGLQAEGIFRINGDNSQEEYVRDQLNSGVIPDGVDVHCLAGLIKAWFRELPTGILDSLSPGQVSQSHSEEECARLTSQLPPTEVALLDWAVNLMADVAEHEHVNKMNARNVALVFAPNMTQMADPMTALMYAVQVMNFLKSLITRKLRNREGSAIEPSHDSHTECSNGNGHHSSCQLIEVEKIFSREVPTEDFTAESITQTPITPKEHIPGERNGLGDSCPWKVVTEANSQVDRCHWEVGSKGNTRSSGIQTGDSGRSSKPNPKIKKVK